MARAQQVALRPFYFAAIIGLPRAYADLTRSLHASGLVTHAREGHVARHRSSFVPPASVASDQAAPSERRRLSISGAVALQQVASEPANRSAPHLRAFDTKTPEIPVMATAMAPPQEAGSVVFEPKTVAAEDVAIGTNLWKAYCSASFAGGLTVGVVGTLLMLSIGVDRLPGKVFGKGGHPEIAGPELQPEYSEAVEVTQPSCPNSSADSATASVESIHRFGPRCGFLVAMLLVQSLSSLMLAGFQDLIQNHPSIIFFLTMVVGTGGNVGGQSVVLAVRRLAYGESVSMSEQAAVGVQLSAVLAPLALLRAYAQGTKLAVCLTIGLATSLIVAIAALLGTALPKLLNRVGVDPAHATPIIQVLMDMVGVLVTCVIGYGVLDVVLKEATN